MGTCQTTLVVYALCRSIYHFFSIILRDKKYFFFFAFHFKIFKHCLLTHTITSMYGSLPYNIRGSTYACQQHQCKLLCLLMRHLLIHPIHMNGYSCIKLVMIFITSSFLSLSLSHHFGSSACVHVCVSITF